MRRFVLFHIVVASNVVYLDLALECHVIHAGEAPVKKRYDKVLDDDYYNAYNTCYNKLTKCSVDSF